MCREVLALRLERTVSYSQYFAKGLKGIKTYLNLTKSVYTQNIPLFKNYCGDHSTPFIPNCDINRHKTSRCCLKKRHLNSESH